MKKEGESDRKKRGEVRIRGRGKEKRCAGKGKRIFSKVLEKFFNRTLCENLPQHFKCRKGEGKGERGRKKDK